MIFDIGANDGRWALPNIDSCNKIIALEPVPQTFDRLVENCKKHENIICLKYVVCNNNNEDIIFYEAAADTLSTLHKDWLTSENSRFYRYTDYREIKCKTKTLDKLIEEYGMPDLIKIDVECGEYECISSLTQKVNMLCFEWASETNDITLKCLDYLSELGFTQFYLQHEDVYTFRPTEFYDVSVIEEQLKTMIPKKDWGMIWCK